MGKPIHDNGGRFELIGQGCRRSAVAETRQAFGPGIFFVGLLDSK